MTTRGRVLLSLSAQAPLLRLVADLLQAFDVCAYSLHNSLRICCGPELACHWKCCTTNLQEIQVVGVWVLGLNLCLFYLLTLQKTWLSTAESSRQFVFQSVDSIKGWTLGHVPPSTRLFNFSDTLRSILSHTNSDMRLHVAACPVTTA